MPDIGMMMALTGGEIAMRSRLGIAFVVVMLEEERDDFRHLMMVHLRLMLEIGFSAKEIAWSSAST
jgi:hypothetical protein